MGVTQRERERLRGRSRVGVGVNKEMEIAPRMMVGGRFTRQEAEKTARKEED